MDPNDLAWTAFRAGLLAPLLTGEVTSQERASYFRDLSQKQHTLPNGKVGTISVRTLRRWYQQLRTDGIDRLSPQRRSDRGQARRANRDKIKRAIELKRKGPSRSDQVINKILQGEFGSGLPASTLYRHLAIHGATRKRLGLEEKKVRCHWTRDLPNSLWMGDFSHGPVVLVDGLPKRTHLSAWMDMHSRYVVEARFYLNEKLDKLIDSLLRALAKHGAPLTLYADNGKVYHANGLVVACAKLGIRKLHRPPREPEPGGLIERFFQTVQSQFLAEVALCKPITFTQLNQAFNSWLSSGYHQQVHSVTRQTPHALYYAPSRTFRPVDVMEVESCFYRRETRTVDKTFSDVSLDNRLYKVDQRLRGMKVYVLSNPFVRDPQQPDEVQIYDLQDKYLGVGQRHVRQLVAGQSQQPSPTPAPLELEESPYVKSLLEDEQRRLANACEAGIDYRTAMQRDVLTLSGLCSQLSRLLGRRGGVSALLADEQEAIAAFYQKHPQVRSWQVQRAAEQVAGSDLPELLLAISVQLKMGNMSLPHPSGAPKASER